MHETLALSESAVAVLRICVKGYRMKVGDRSLEAFRELVAAGIMTQVASADGNSEADYKFTQDGWARRQELLSEAEDELSGSDSSRPTGVVCQKRLGNCCVVGWLVIER